MEHQFYIDRLSAYFDNELKNEEFVIVKEHIDQCDECQKQLRELEKLENLFSTKTELSENDYWEQSAQKIESALGEQNQTEIIPVAEKASLPWWKLTALAASLVLVVLITLEEKEEDGVFQRENNYNSTIEKKDMREEAPVVIDTTIRDELSVGRVELRTEEETGDLGNVEELIEDEDITFHNQPVEKSKSKPQVSSKPKTVKNDLTKQKSKLVEEKDVIDNYEIGKTISTNKKLAESDMLAETTTLIKVEKNFDQSISAKVGEESPQETSDSEVFELMDLAIDNKSTDKDIDSSVESPKLSFNNFQSIEVVTAVNESDQKSTSKITKINYWRRMLETNNELLKDQNKKVISYSKSNKKRSVKSKKSVQNIDLNFVYKQLFEAHYNIAILTTDSTEEQKSIQFLTKHANSVEKEYNSDALYYLQLYKNKQKQD